VTLLCVIDSEMVAF